MKSLQRPEFVSGEFEGETFDEAVQLAREELGNTAPVRCWKVRRGGVLGFFARETYVAGLTPPQGSTGTVRTSAPVRPDRERLSSPWLSAPRTSSLNSPERSASDIASRSPLSHLVEATRDEVVLGSDIVTESAFSEVLAQAEAALSRFSLVDDVTGPASSEQPTSEKVRPIEGLRSRLVDLGVPDAYLPEESEGTLDGLARLLSTMPIPQLLPPAEGSIIVVVGSRWEALTVGQHVVAILGLDASSLVVAERTSAGRQRVARRRSMKKATVLVVEAALGSRDLSDAATWVERLAPEYVLGAVAATAKRSDVARWRAQLGRIDSLALSRLAHTTTVGELMDGLPILLLDGARASTLRWLIVLLQSMADYEQ
ncbi:MAG TPA: hypothetical protein VMU68_11465 [Acidimicrobiales bacterium]|nr:hypothetical protein [Acidimicrobiales bacterium]